MLKLQKLEGERKMINTALGNLQFNIGWKSEIPITLFKRIHQVILKVRAYRETDGITDEQQEALRYFKNHSVEQMKDVEDLLTSYAGKEHNDRFVPRTLIIERDGEMALLCDDENFPDNGIAVVLYPIRKIVMQDDYL